MRQFRPHDVQHSIAVRTLFVHVPTERSFLAGQHQIFVTNNCAIVTNLSCNLQSSNAIRIHTGSVRLPSCHRRTTAEVDVQIIGLYDKPN